MFAENVPGPCLVRTGADRSQGTPALVNWCSTGVKDSLAAATAMLWRNEGVAGWHGAAIPVLHRDPVNRCGFIADGTAIRLAPADCGRPLVAINATMRRSPDSVACADMATGTVPPFATLQEGFMT